jgi:hypothetical protein
VRIRRNGRHLHEQRKGGNHSWPSVGLSAVADADAALEYGRVLNQFSRPVIDDLKTEGDIISAKHLWLANGQLGFLLLR